MASVTFDMSVLNSAAMSLQHEHQKKEIEGVERPSEKAGRDDMLLLAGPTRESRDSHDRSNHRTGIVA